MKLNTMQPSSMFGTKMGAGTSILGAITAWLPHLETTLRIGASIVAIVAGLYAILNYAADLKNKRQNHEKNKNNTRTANTIGNPDRLHSDEGD